MSSPRWFDELPEYMTETRYRDLPEEISRTIEIVHGHVIKCHSPTPRHNRITRRLANALEAARSASDPCLTIDTNIEVVLWRVPRFTFRRPGVIVYECIEDPIRRPAAQETVMVVEVTSPTTAREDQVDKKAQYAAAGIPIYLIVLLDETYDIVDIREFHLDAATSVYRLYAVHHSVLDLEHPVWLSLPISDLVTP